MYTEYQNSDFVEIKLRHVENNKKYSMYSKTV